MKNTGLKSTKFSRSSFCTDAHGCVEVNVGRYGIRVRDAKDPASAPLTFTPAEWDAFIRGVKAGEFDI